MKKKRASMSYSTREIEVLSIVLEAVKQGKGGGALANQYAKELSGLHYKTLAAKNRLAEQQQQESNGTAEAKQ